MKKYIYIFIFFIFTLESQSHTSHYSGIKVINMDIYKDDKLIGYSNYFFDHRNNETEVANTLISAIELNKKSEISFFNDSLLNFQSKYESILENIEKLP